MNKYRNQKIEVDGMTFDSRKEYKRWQELRLLQRAGEITDLNRQVPFGLMPSFKCNGHLYRPTTYIADFTYYDKNHKYIVEDVKGVRTKEYMIKKKLLAWLHGYEIQEV